KKLRENLFKFDETKARIFRLRLGYLKSNDDTIALFLASSFDAFESQSADVRKELFNRVC
ncbi:hypothetical protein SOVF_184830, partial [Spinacia oleracea]